MFIFITSEPHFRVKADHREPALLNLKHCCVNQWLSEIRILASSMQGDSVPDAFMAI
jgi:hypothetical protein